MSSIPQIAKPWISDLGIYEPGKPIEELARELGLDSADEITKLASNENSLGPSPLAIQAMQRAAENMHRYPDGGAFYLRAALARKLNVDAAQLLVANGSNELLEFLGHVFLDETSNIVVSECAFVVYRLIATACRARTIAVPMRDYTHDLDAMLAAITPETRIVFVSNPNNPTGTMVTAEELDSFIDKVPGHVLVALDEAYVELLAPDKQPDSISYVKDDRNVIVLRTFSKTYGLAGLRIGYAVAPTDCIHLLNRVRQPFNANAMALEAAVAALGDDDHVERTRTMVRDGLKFFGDACNEMGLPFVPSVTNFMLIEIGEGRRTFEAAKQERLIVRAMDVYGLPSHIRVTIGTMEENEQCIRALKTVLEARK